MNRVFDRIRGRGLYASISAIALSAALAAPANALIPRDDVGPDNAIDTANTWAGVGQMFSAIDVGGGFFSIGRCTVQLINPRAVVFAAHCINDFPDSAYGVGGPNGLGFGFAVDNTPGWQNWFFGGFTTDLGTDFYNAIQVQTPFGTTVGFPGGDVALGTLDTAAIGIPTYGMLFSPVDGPIRADQVGYGQTGTGSTGPIPGAGLFDPLSNSRRAGENMLDALISQNDFLAGVFQQPGTPLFGVEGSQPLYFTDFDRPDRDPDACVRDFTFGTPDIVCNAPAFFVSLGGTFLLPSDEIDYFPGDALALESGTAPGDSGGGLFVRPGGFADPLVAGVLSGGFTFTSPLGGYGDVSYYNPLFLYHEWITAQNPYVYASAAAGDGVWSDPTRWTQTLDPNYYIIDADGNVINGVPVAPEGGLFADDPKFGIIFDSDVADVEGALTPEDPSDPAGGAAGTSASLATTNGLQTDTLQATPGGGAPGATVGTQGEIETTISEEPETDTPATEANSASTTGPTGFGSTGFVPNNDFGTFGSFAGGAAGEVARFYDITLSNAGLTTVDMDVEIDRLTVSGDAALSIGAPWTFNTLIGTEQYGGLVTVDGTMNTREYILGGGVLTGSGSLTTQNDLFNLMGVFAPGGVNEVGALDVTGDYIQTSGGTLVVDVGPGGADLLNVDGDISLAGQLALNYVDGAVPFAGQNGQFITFTGSSLGNFDTIADLPGVLFATSTVNANNVVFNIDAASFLTELPANATENQLSQALALDAARGTSAAAMADLFRQIDILSGDALAGAFDLIAPRDALSAGMNMQFLSQSASSRFENRFVATRGGANRGAQFHGGSEGVEVASADPMEAFHAVTTPAAGTPIGGPRSLPMAEGWGLFGELAFARGEGDTGFGVENDIEAATFTIGLDRTVGPSTLLGVMASVNTGDNDFDANLGGSSLDGISLSAYGSFEAALATLDGYLGFGALSIDNARIAPFGTASFRTEGETDADQFIAGIALSRQFDHANGIAFIPAAALDYADYEIDGYTETGAVTALNIDGRSVTTFQASAGGRIAWTRGFQGANIFPSFGLRAVYDFENDRDVVTGSYVLAPTATFIAVGPERDEFWGEYDFGLTFAIDSMATGRISYTGTFERDDLDYGRLGADLRIQF